MDITKEEIQQALRISRAIQNYIELTGSRDLRSTDVFPYLSRKGLFERDTRHNGKHFRKFLKRLYNANMLENLVPQCRYLRGVGDQVMGEWYFNDAKDKMPKVISVKMNAAQEKPAPMTLPAAKKLMQSLVDGIHPLTYKNLPESEASMHPTVREALQLLISSLSEDDPAQKDDLQSDPEGYCESPKSKKEQDSECKGLEISYDQSIPAEELLKGWREEVNAWETTLDLDALSENVLAIRRKYPRAYEKWADREKEIVLQAYSLTRSTSKVAELTQRTTNSIQLTIDRLHKKLEESR
ncbi:hypothetical protein [Leeuwenhoekiella parthenopeia]|nr:hypothetical protein [Leeuwenhoekiella parthenopeia]